MKNLEVKSIFINFFVVSIALICFNLLSIGSVYGQKHKIANYKAESWGMVMSELHEHVEELADFVHEGELKKIEAVIPEVIEHAEEMIQVSQKSNNEEGVTYGKKIKETASAILEAAQTGDADKIKIRLNDINKYVHKIMASNPSWMIEEMHLHIKEMRAALKKGDTNELTDIAQETYGHMTDLSTYLKKLGNMAAAQTSKESREYMKEVKKEKNVSANISKFEDVLNKLAAQI